MQIPKVINWRKRFDLQKAATLFCNDYEKHVFPLLFKLDLLDDEHVRKCMNASTFETIFRDAEAEQPDRFLYLQRKAFLEERDFWEVFRGNVEPDKTPADSDFVFRNMPFSDYSLKDCLLKAISVENCKFHIDEKKLDESCVLHPTERQQEIFEFLYDLCEKLREKNLQNENISALLYRDKKGNLRPSLPNLFRCPFVEVKQ